MIHPNQMVAPISNRARLHLQSGGPVRPAHIPEETWATMSEENKLLHGGAEAQAEQAEQAAAVIAPHENTLIGQISGKGQPVAQAAELVRGEDGLTDAERAVKEATPESQEAYIESAADQGITAETDLTIGQSEFNSLGAAAQKALTDQGYRVIDDTGTDVETVGVSDDEKGRKVKKLQRDIETLSNLGVDTSTLQAELDALLGNTEVTTTETTTTGDEPPKVESDESGNTVTSTNGTHTGTLPDGKKVDLTGAGDKLKEFFGIDDQFLGRALLYYLGGRMTGGSHAGSLRWAGQQAIKELNARDVAAQQRKQKIAEKYGGMDAETIKRIQALEAKGIDTSKKADKYVRSTGDDRGEIVEVFHGPGGAFTYNADTGAVEEFDTSGYEKWSVEQHAIENVQSNLRQHIDNLASEGDYKYNVGDEDNPRYKYRVNPTSFSTGYTQWLKNTYGENGYVYANTPEGRAQAESMYKAAHNWSTKTKKPIEHWNGFFAALNTGVYGADGHANRQVPGLYTTAKGETVNLKHYTTMNNNLADFRAKFPKIKTNGAAMKLALDAWENPQTEAERELVKKIKDMKKEGKIPKDSSATVAFVTAYFGQ